MEASARQVRDGTKDRLIAAAAESLRTGGYAGTSARSIARIGDLNQALVFYHFGSVDRLLLAALEDSSRARMERYITETERVSTLQELVDVARRLYDEDLAAGHITILAEMIGASLARAELRDEVMALMDPWVSFAEQLVARFLDPIGITSMIPAQQIAIAVLGFYLGFNTLSYLGADDARADDLFASATSLTKLFAPMGEQG